MKGFEKLISDLKNRQYLPIYFLDGEESYFIDEITDYIANNVLDDSEKDFNQTVLYGGDIEVVDIINAARRYPMMAPFNVIIVKEAQNIRKFDDFITYVTNPSLTTILVINYKHKKLDGKTKLAKDIAKNGWYFNTEKVKDYLLPEWIVNYGKSQGLTVAPKASIMLAEFLGDDLNKIVNTIKKIQIMLKGEVLIDEKIVYANVGISKEYNYFELQKALITKDIYKANLIANYFGQNEKNYSIIGFVAVTYSFFSKLLKYQFLKSKMTEQQAAAQMGMPPFLMKDYNTAAQHYPLNKVAKIIGFLKDADLKAKGVGASNSNTGELYKELVYKILH